MKYYIIEMYMIKDILNKKNFVILDTEELNYQIQLNIFKKFVTLFKN